MGTITRHAGAPFAAGEVSSAADLEADIAACYAEFNGNIEDSNLSADDPFDGRALQDGSVDNTRVTTTAADLISVGKQAKRCYISTGNASENMTEALNAWTEVPGVTPITVVPYTANDTILIRFTVSYSVSSGGSGDRWAWSFSIDGSNVDALNYDTPVLNATAATHTTSYNWALTAGSPIPRVIRPIYVSTTVGDEGTFASGFEANKIFTAVVLPG